jgi:hypothetical protein
LPEPDDNDLAPHGLERREPWAGRSGQRRQAEADDHGKSKSSGPSDMAVSSHREHLFLLPGM